jgi:hypothetical protein
LGEVQEEETKLTINFLLVSSCYLSLFGLLLIFLVCKI